LTDIYSKENKNTSQNDTSEGSSLLSNPCCYIPLIMFIIAFTLGALQSRCPNCGKFWAGRKIGERNLGIGPETEMNSNRIRSYQHYNSILQCKKCGYHFPIKGKRGV